MDSPFSNGLNERLNQTLVNKIRCKINEKDRKIAWTTLAQEYTQMYNETEHTTTGFTPKYLMDGTVSVSIPDELQQNFSLENWLRDRKIAIENTIKSHNKNKKIFD